MGKGKEEAGEGAPKERATHEERCTTHEGRVEGGRQPEKTKTTKKGWEGKGPPTRKGEPRAGEGGEAHAKGRPPKRERRSVGWVSPTEKGRPPTRKDKESTPRSEVRSTNGMRELH